MLLDSHVLLWWMDDDSRLGPQSRRSLSSAARPSFSAASILELMLEVREGGLTIPETFESEVRRSGLDEIPVTAEHARAVLSFPELARHDPFDSLLVAQAHAERLELLTADRVLLALDLPFVKDARA
ncbi:type II toxin-antitoxin system VapC family toxin [Georgenia subflava]|nr:type II toxin-antitoxin system VapC family toxin [Georgenia subflava]